MENYNQNQQMASVQQLNYLKRLGYKGNENLTSAQASDLIKKYVAGQNQNQQSGYQQPQQQAPQSNLPTNYNAGSIVETRTGENVEITPATVRDYLGVELTQPEFNYFFSVCNLYGLNPFIKDIYPIKFGTQPATFVIDYKVMQQAADENPMFDGLQTGLLFLDKNGNPQERAGAYLLPNERLLGAWCDVYRKDRTHTNRTYALYEENKKLTKNGEVTTMWKDKPIFMITKVAKAQALRETFPNMFSNNTYTADEIDTESKSKPNADFTYDTNGVIRQQNDATASITPNIEEDEPTPTPNQKPNQEPQEETYTQPDLGF